METKDTPLVSVVVPVYKVENYVAKCIESILNQTYGNLELILVDDGSPDNSGAICDEYALKDGRVRVIHTSNHGVSHARNTGMDNASGEYLFFVDSDDWLESEHIEVSLPIEDEDLVYGGRKFFVKGQFVENRTTSAQMVECREWLSDYSGFVRRGLVVFFLSGCYRMELIRQNKLAFNTDLSISEDGLFNIEYMKHCRRIRYSDASTYCYEDGDVTTVSLSRSFHAQRMSAEMEKLKAIESMTQKKEYFIRWREWCSILRHYRYWSENGAKKSEARRCLRECYKNEFFRECIPFIRENGTLDEKVETYFMGYWWHPFYKPCYGSITFLSKVKRLLCRNTGG